MATATIVLTESEENVMSCDVSGDLDGPEGLTTVGMAAAAMVASLAQYVKSVEWVEADDVQR